MTYDYYGAWDNVTGINAPLYGNDFMEEDDEEHWKNVVSYNDNGIESFDFYTRIIQYIIGCPKVVQRRNLT